MSSFEVSHDQLLPNTDDKNKEEKTNNNILADTMSQPTDGLTFTDVILVDAALNALKPPSVITQQPLPGDGVKIEEISQDGCCECGDNECDCGDCECDGCCDCDGCDCDCGDCVIS